MRGPRWTDAEIAELLDLGWQVYAERHPERTPDACRVRHNAERRKRAAEQTAPVEPLDKPVPRFDWREATAHVKQLQRIRREYSASQSTALIRIEADAPICVVALSDTHVGSWSTDYERLIAITDEIMGTPNLYVALLGDLANMAIKLRGVAEVKDDLLPPDMQLAFIDAWLNEIADRVLFCTWDNHAVEREEQGTGLSAFARLQSRRFVYHGGIGHPDVRVGEQTYRFAVSHRFLGRNYLNPTHAAMRYLRHEGHDREIAMQGDYHVPGIAKFTHGPTTKVAIHTGSLQTESGYAKRWFSLTTHPVFPCVVLHPHQHMMIPFWSIAEWKAIAGIP